MKIKAEELTGAALDWAVAKVEGNDYLDICGNPAPAFALRYSSDWALGGPLLESHRVGLGYIGDKWLATEGETNEGCGSSACGPTQLIAGMRAIVIAEIGDHVDIPHQLMATEDQP